MAVRPLRSVVRLLRRQGNAAVERKQEKNPNLVNWSAGEEL
ncbi:MAG: hypothetical protein ACLR4Z_08845 [Butyricicoccaceae bacterium]